jgi:P4 family phage/plasmid primase-like protien
MAQPVEAIKSKLDYALALAGAGYRIFPCIPNGKDPLTSNGFHGGTRDETQIKEWWSRHPDANICVTADGVLVLDVDVKKGPGDENLFDWMQENGYEFPEGAMATRVSTPSGGWHLYFRDPGNAVGRCAQNDPVAFVDLRGGNKGYAIGIGSYVISKKPGEKEYEGPYTGSIIPVRSLPLAPEWLQKRESSPKKAPVLRVVPTGSDTSTVKRLLSKIEPSSLSYEAWIKVGMACKSASEDSLDLWDEWSAKDSRYIPGECSRKWESFKGEGVSVGTLYHFAGESREESLSARIAASGLDEDIQSEIRNGDAILASDYLTKHRNFHYFERVWSAWDGNWWLAGEEGKAKAGYLVQEYITGELVEAIQKGTVKDRARQKYLFSRLAAVPMRHVVDLIADRANWPAPRFNENLELLGTKNKLVLDLATTEARAATYADKVNTQLGAAYDPEAKCPKWEDFLLKAMEGDADKVRYLQVLTGYCLAPTMQHQEFYFLYGVPQSGKSTFLNTLAALFGQYGTEVSTDALVLTEKGATSNETDKTLAAMKGKRFVLAGKEMEDGHRLNSALMKSLSGDANITGRAMYTGFETFPNLARIFLFGNFMPSANFSDEALKRRLRVIKFNRACPVAERDDCLSQYLKETELPGILNWAIEGYRIWVASGKDLRGLTPAAVIADSESYFDELNTAKKFLALKVQKNDGTSKGIPVSELNEAYRVFCSQEGERTPPRLSATLAAELKKSGLKADTVNARHNGGDPQRTYWAVMWKDTTPEASPEM